MYGGSIRLYTPMLFSVGFLILFSIGGFTGIVLANAAIDTSLHDTYFVVAQMGLSIGDYCLEIDYMLGTILIYYLLFYKINNLFLIDISRSFNLLLNSENNNNIEAVIYNNYSNIQSAGNPQRGGSSETIRQLSNSKEDSKFYNWLAGIIDGDGNFDIRNGPDNKLTLKSIRIKLHNRDIRILNRIQNFLHCGRIRSDKNKPYSLYIVSTKKEMSFIINQINGLIRIKVPALKKACSCLNIDYIEANYTIKPFDPYLSGLIDTDGSIVFNYTANRIECNLEFKYNIYTEKLNLDHVIPYYKPNVYLRKKKNQSPGKEFKSIVFKYQTVTGMIYLYDYFMKNRLFSDIKFYRISQIKYFIEIRHYQKSPQESFEFKIYSSFLLKWIQYRNPLWNRVPFVKKIR